MSPHRRDGLLLAAAVGIVGATFGVLAETAGLTVGQGMAMSALVFTGASQFAAVSVISSGGTIAAALGSALILAARNTLYGQAVRRLLPSRLLPRIVASHFVIDETTAMATAQEDDTAGRDAFWFTAISLWTLWQLGTIGGMLAGRSVADPSLYGLDAAFPAAFIALLVPHLQRRSGLLAALVGGAIALVAIPFTPPGLPILLSALGVLAGLRALRSESP